MVQVGGKRNIKKETKKKKRKNNIVLNVEEQSKSEDEGTVAQVSLDTAESKVNKNDGDIVAVDIGDIEVGKYVLVEFTGKRDKGKGALYIGCVAEVDAVAMKVKTKFLRRADLKKKNVMKFKELEEESEEEKCTEHDSSQVQLILPDPVKLKGTSRISSLLAFEDNHLMKYINDIE